MSSYYLNASYANLGELSPSDNSGENSFDVNYLPSNYGVCDESGYYADSEFIPATSEHSPQLGPDVYSDSHLGYDGTQVLPIYYPIPTYYQVYYGVSSVENNGTTFYHYYPFAVPIYCLSSDVTSENSITSDGNSVSYSDEFPNEIVENDNEDSSSHQATLSSNNSNYVADNAPLEELIDEFAEYYDELRDSSLPVHENDFTAEDKKNEVKMKKDWLYLLALSGKLRLKASIPEVQIFTAIIEEERENDEGDESSESPVVDTESFEDISPKIDESYEDQDKENPKRDVIESSYANGAHKEKCQATGEENDLWKDFFCSIDDPVFGIEPCFNSSSEKELINESFDNDLDKNNVNLLSTCRKTFMILGRLNKQIEILPTIDEEEEPVVKSEDLCIMTENPPLQINKENTIVCEEGCLRSTQQNAEEMENSCGIAEATEEKNPNENEIESSFANGAHKEKCQASGVENDLWNDFFYSIDDPVFEIEACFDNSSEKESSNNDLDKKNFNLSTTNGKTFMILPRLNKQIQILPTIEEEEEPVLKSEELHVMIEKPPLDINKENTTHIEEGCLESKQQSAEKVENNCGLPDATVEVSTSEKPKKKKFQRIRRFFSELRSCFRKSKDPPG